MILRRVLRAGLIIWLAATLAFFMLRILPGDAITQQLTLGGASDDTIAAQKQRLGLDQPLIAQYGLYLAGMLRGDMGISLVDRQPVTGLILYFLMPTLQLTLAALAAASLFGILLGILNALSIGMGVSTFARVITALSMGVPVYLTGTIALYLFTAQSLDGGILLPVLVLGFHVAGAIARVLQARLQETLHADYVRAARARGLNSLLILRRHVLRPALLPVITVIALQGGFLLGGTVIIESLFLRPGIGKLLLERTMLQDYPVVQGVVVMSAVAYTLLNLSADLLYHLIDPRIGAEG